MLHKDTKKEIPKFRLQSLFKIQEQLYETLSVYTGSQFSTPSALDMVTDEISFLFPVVDPTVIKFSLQPFTSSKLTDDALTTFCAQFAAEFQSLCAGHPLVPFVALQQPTWAVVEVIRTLPGRTSKNKLASKLTFKVLTGPAAGQRFTKLCSDRYLAYIASRVGFSRRKEHRRYKGVRASFFGFRFCVLLESDIDTQPMFYGEAKLRFKKIALGRYIAHNQKLLKKRVDIKCHKGLTNPCCKCLQGIDQCHRACRLTTITVNTCSKCNSDKALFDKDFCLNCHYKLAMEVKK